MNDLRRYMSIVEAAAPMKRYRVVFQFRGEPLYGGNAYIVDARNEAHARRQVRELLIDRFGSRQPSMADMNRQVVPRIVYADELDPPPS